MKKIILASTLALITASALAQIDDVINKPRTKKEYKGPNTKPVNLITTGFFNFLFRRIHSLDVSGQAQSMIKDGVTERKFAAVFSISGSLVNWYEIDNSNGGIEEYDDIGSNVGVQIVPYTLKLSPENKSFYLAINPVSLRNMNTLQSGQHPWNSNGTNDKADSFWKVVDNVDFLVLKWDQNMNFENINSFNLDVIHANLKFDLLGSSKPARYLALTAGGTFGASKSDVTLDDGSVIRIRTEKNAMSGGDKFLSGLSVRLGYEYGLEYHDKWSNGDELRITGGIAGAKATGYFIDQKKVNAANDRYTAAMDEYEAGRQAYAAKYGCGYSGYEGGCMDPWEYEMNTGIVQPKAEATTADKIIRKQVYVTPGIEFSKNVKKTGRPLRVGLSVSGNIPLKDQLTGGSVNEDLSNHNKNLYNAKLFINF